MIKQINTLFSATATCGDPTVIQHATYVYNDDGTEATYTCIDGYEFVNAAQNKLQCSAANQWTGTQFPVCNLKGNKLCIMLTFLCKVDPLAFHFYVVKMRFTWVYFIF